MGKGDKANARKSFEQSLALRKDYMPSAMLLARLDLEDNQPDRARERFKGALKADPKDLDAMIGLASIDRSTGNMTGYRDWLEKAHKMDPSAEAPALLLGRYYLTKRDFAKAEAVAKDVLATQPRHPDMINLLAEAQAARGDKLTAMRTYARLAETVPLSADAHYKLAMARLATGDYERAGESLRAALKLKPDHVDALAAMALVEYQAGNYSEVIRLARQVQRLAPQLPIGLILEGDGLMAVHDYGAAGNAYERAFAMRKTDALAVKLHAAKSQVGNKDEATARLVAWQRYHPKETGSRLYLADVYVRAGQKTQAIELYEQVLDLDPQNLLALNNVATLYQQNKDPRALQYFEQSYKLNPESATLADNLGWALVQQGELQKGVELLYKATAKAPDNPDMRYHLVAAIAKSGEKERAREELQKLLSKYIDFQHRQDAQTLLEQLGGPPG